MIGKSMVNETVDLDSRGEDSLFVPFIYKRFIFTLNKLKYSVVMTKLY